jgi:probable phosphoglycerate mutase
MPYRRWRLVHDMSTTATWMRHGTCADGLFRPAAHARPESPLTAAGKQEVELAALRLRSGSAEVAIVTSSPLIRARQTAAVVAQGLNSRLAEPFDVFAEWHAPDCVLGLAPHEYPAAYLDWRVRRATDPDSALLGGESLTDFAARAVDATALATLLTEIHGQVIIVSHRLIIGAVAAFYSGLQHPAEVFEAAADFRLRPAHLWPTPPTFHPGSS